MFTQNQKNNRGCSVLSEDVLWRNDNLEPKTNIQTLFSNKDTHRITLITKQALKLNLQMEFAREDGTKLK